MGRDLAMDLDLLGGGSISMRSSKTETARIGNRFEEEKRVRERKNTEKGAANFEREEESSETRRKACGSGERAPGVGEAWMLVVSQAVRPTTKIALRNRKKKKMVKTYWQR